MIKQWQRRLYLKWLWYKHAYPFNWAHKPLCSHFRNDVIQMRSVYLCRSCVMAYAGIGIAVLSSVAFPGAADRFGPIILLLCCAAILPFSFPKLYKKLPRLIRDFLRFIMGCTIVLCLYLVLSGQYLPGLTGVFLLFLFWTVYMRGRRIIKLKACDCCSEFGKQDICSGFRFQAERIRLYENEATDFLLASGYIPGITRTKT